MSDATFPYRVGCVDTGSNAIRVYVAEFSDPMTYEPLHYERVPIRLGHQVFVNGRLDSGAIDAAVEAFQGFRQQFDALGVQSFRTVATSAVREAKNGPLLVDRIMRESGIDLHVISGSEEARLVHRAVASRVDLAGGQWILVDLGGGSVEISLVDDMGMLWTESHTMGSVRLLEVLSGNGDDRGQFQRLLQEYVGILRIPFPAQYWEPAGFVATGGNIEALANLTAAPADARGTRRIPMKDLESAIELLSRLSYTDRMEQLDMKEDRADVILPASLVYQRLARLSNSDHIVVPGVGVKDGILLDLVDDHVSHAQHLAQGEAQMMKAAISIGRRYLFDEAHALHVSHLARSLFEQLRPVHRLPERQRLFLTAAALLQDIGTFVSQKGHHKHTLYLLSRSELPGFSARDMRVTANIARYHRGAHPQLGHPEFAALSTRHKARVRQLAALLRLADAMDRQQRQLVQAVDVEIENRDVTLRLHGTGELLLERWALNKKKSLFEETFGMSVYIAG